MKFIDNLILFEKISYQIYNKEYMKKTFGQLILSYMLGNNVIYKIQF